MLQDEISHYLMSVMTKNYLADSNVAAFVFPMAPKPTPTANPSENRQT